MATKADAEHLVTVQYIGPLTAVEIMNDDQYVTIAHGETLEVSAADAAWLCQQEENWALLTPKEQKAAARKDAAAAERRDGSKDEEGS